VKNDISEYICNQTRTAVGLDFVTFSLFHPQLNIVYRAVAQQLNLNSRLGDWVQSHGGSIETSGGETDTPETSQF
jgi:hypothetical protein